MTAPILILATLAVLLCSCERGPSEEDMAGCASHRTPAWGDLIDCKAEKERAKAEEK